MSYPRSLDEYADEELEAEIKRRKKLKKKKLCTYCERSVDAPHCRFPERHTFKKGMRDNEPRLIVGDTIYTLSEAFCQGAIAHLDRVPYTENPYDEDDDQAWGWNCGHEVVDTDEEDLEPGVDLSREFFEKALAEAKARRL